MKEYIVALKDGIDLDSFWNEMETATNGLLHIPDRAVAIANNRTYLERICEYWLTDAEADLLKNDSRVLSVEIPVRNNPMVSVVSHSTQNIAGMNYTKQAGSITIDYTTGNLTSFPSANYNPPLDASTNWGLIRHSYQANPYGANPTGSSNSATDKLYNYVLDGADVDVIINDSGIQSDHPEFAGRIVNVNWNSIAAAVGAVANVTLPNNTVVSWNTASYTDTDGHGTNVAGIAAGATYGWAKGANIIPLYYSTSGQSSADPLDIFEMMIYWHQHKGTNNPTIVNMSWALGVFFSRTSGTGYYSLINSGSYRGNTILSGQSNSYYQSRGLVALTGNGLILQANTWSLPYSSLAYNAALGHVIDAGIVVCQSAANNGFKIDVLGGDDYNNYFINAGTTYYYHRGASPKDPRAIVVGALDTKTSASAQDQRAQYSCAGPGVDIWAAGTYIMSAGCTNPANTSPQYGHDNSYYLNGIGESFKEFIDTGTSQASPQVAGMSALYLQAYPPANIYSASNSSTVKSWLTNNAVGNTFNATGNSVSYIDGTSLLGGQPRVAYQAIQGLSQIKNAAGQWRSVKNIQIKNASGSWQAVKTVWVKDGNTWKPAYTKST